MTTYRCTKGYVRARNQGFDNSNRHGFGLRFGSVVNVVFETNKPIFGCHRSRQILGEYEVTSPWLELLEELILFVHRWLIRHYGDIFAMVDLHLATYVLDHCRISCGIFNRHVNSKFPTFAKTEITCSESYLSKSIDSLGRS